MEQTLTAPATAEQPPADRDAAGAAAFEALYRSSRDDVFAYVAGLLRDRSAAEDVTALAFERAYRKRRRFDPRKGSRRAWLFGIARNAALDELRRRSSLAELSTDPEDATVISAPDHAEAAMRKELLRTAMRRLDRRERELIALKFFAGLDNAEIAAVIGVSQSNAGTRLHRIIEKLRRACNDRA